MRGEYAAGDEGLTPPSALGQMPFTLPREAPVALAASSTGRPLLRIHRARPGHRREGRGDQQPPGGPIEGVGKAVLVEVHQRLDRASCDRQVRQDHRAGGVVVPVVVRRELIGPHERAVARPARQHAGAPLVVPEPLLGIVRGGVAGAVVDQIELGVIGDRAPHRSTAGAPAVARPAVHAEVGAAVVGCLEGARTDQHVGIGSHVVGGPHHLAGVQIESLEPAVDAELPARSADDHPIAHHDRGHRHGLAASHIGDAHPPQLASRAGIDRHGVAIEQVVDDPAVGVERSAVDGIAAGDTDGIGADVGPVLPPQRIVLARQVERIQHVRPGRNDVHRGADDQRLPFVAARARRWRMSTPGAARAHSAA